MTIFTSIRKILLFVSVYGAIAAFVLVSRMITGNYSLWPILLILILLIVGLLRMARMKIIIGSTHLTYVSPVSEQAMNFAEIVALKIRTPFPGKMCLDICGAAKSSQKPTVIEIQLSMFRLEDLAALVNAALSSNPRISVDDRVQDIFVAQTQEVTKRFQYANLLWWFLLFVILIKSLPSLILLATIAINYLSR